MGRQIVNAKGSGAVITGPGEALLSWMQGFKTGRSVLPGQHPVTLQSVKFKNTKFKYITFLKIYVIHQNKA